MKERKTFSLLLKDLSPKQLELIKRAFLIWEKAKDDPILSFCKGLSLLEHNVFKNELKYYIRKANNNE